MKYYVTYKVEARYVAEVEAESVAAAIEEANCKFLANSQVNSSLL